MKVVVIVPYRAADEARDRAWRIAYPHYAAWGWPIWTGDTDGDFARAAAINAAAAQGTWDAAVIADADTIQESEPVARAVEMLDKVGAVVPWDTRWKLSELATRRIEAAGFSFEGERDLDPDDGFAHPKKLRGYPPTRTGSTVVVSRETWDLVGGFDEDYRGWGFEDQAFRWAVKVRGRGIVSIPGTIYHLWHPHQPRGELTRLNAKRFNRYRKAAVR